MAKKEDVSKKKAGTPAAGKKETEASAAGTQETETPADANQEIEAPADANQEIEAPAEDQQDSKTLALESAADLEVAYPQLVQAIRDEVVRDIGKCSAGELRANLPELYQRIVIEVQGKSGSILKVPGYLLEVDDPFAEGTLRTYQRLKGVDGLRLPYVLPYKDKVTKAVLGNYILRAEGSGDTKRANAAREAMKKR